MYSYTYPLLRSLVVESITLFNKENPRSSAFTPLVNIQVILTFPPSAKLVVLSQTQKSFC